MHHHSITSATGTDGPRPRAYRSVSGGTVQATTGLARTPASRAHRKRRRSPAYPAWWRKQAACIRWHESRNQWHINTGNGYYGAYQFMWSTWRSVGGTQRPDLASPRMQTFRAWRVWKRDGGSWREWGTAGLCS